MLIVATSLQHHPADTCGVVLKGLCLYVLGRVPIPALQATALVRGSRQWQVSGHGPCTCCRAVYTWRLLEQFWYIYLGIVERVFSIRPPLSGTTLLCVGRRRCCCAALAMSHYACK